MGTQKGQLGILLGATGLMLALFLGCGSSVDPGAGGGTGPVCYNNTDCVPNGCCGTSSSVTDKAHAPNCSTQTCANACPVEDLNCGCGTPVCKDSHCAIATTTGGTCGGRVFGSGSAP